MRIISDAQVRTTILPRITLSSLLHSQAVALQSLQPTSSTPSPHTTAQCPPRLSLHTPNHTQLFMPARTNTPDSVVKIVSVPTSTSNVASGIPGVNLLFDDSTGKPSHVVGSTYLTALRTAAGSLASSIIALGGVRERVKSVVVFGDGAQAVFHVWLHLRYFTSLQSVVVVVGSHKSLSTQEVDEKRRNFSARLDDLCSTGQYTINCISGQDRNAVKTALKEASLVFTCTPSNTPLLDHSDLPINKPQHICAVGSYTPSMCELPASLIRSTSLITGALTVDSIESCAKEAGCLLQALPPTDVHTRCIELAKLLPTPQSSDGGVKGYLQLVERQAVEYGSGREEEGGMVTVFKSVGVGVQDVEITKLVVSLADDVGTHVAF
ncbi:uncharacterized protein SPSC_04980 [Sporisorium scitamineum]|uniref:Ornithine cyclodeaminase n=1 Tax=Sporisorium scitamineum TaxID=49012 RepID=A0A0F7RT08_9BASI|nr:hypothetical protein [Sporisorium scitamineum]CDU25146.1 uncharacterized protein SPSC_04980 [Sporisorium scitamineum]